MMIETAVMTNELPIAAGDVFRVIDTPAVPPAPSSSPPHNGSTAKNGHRRTSSAASDVAKAAGIDIEAVSMSEARKIMSEEHKILGFRPPTGSFAAEIQSAAAKHPEGKPGVAINTNKLKEIAREDALRILAERKTSIGGDAPNGAKPNAGDKHTAPVRHSPPNPDIDLDSISATDARVLMSHEHRALGYRPPPGSLAAEAQSAAARHPEGAGAHLDDETLREIALRDAERIKADRELNIVGDINVSTVGKEGAAEIVSAEAQVLGHRPPAGSIAAQAQSAGDKYPNGGSFNPSANPVELAVLKDAARNEGERLREEEQKASGVNGDVAAINDAKPESMDGATRTVMKLDKAVETDPIEEDASATADVHKPATPPLARIETGDSVEIVCNVLA